MRRGEWTEVLVGSWADRQGKLTFTYDAGCVEEPWVQVVGSDGLSRVSGTVPAAVSAVA